MVRKSRNLELLFAVNSLGKFGKELDKSLEVLIGTVDMHVDGNGKEVLALEPSHQVQLQIFSDFRCQ